MSFKLKTSKREDDCQFTSSHTLKKRCKLLNKKSIQNHLKASDQKMLQKVIDWESEIHGITCNIMQGDKKFLKIRLYEAAYNTVSLAKYGELFDQD